MEGIIHGGAYFRNFTYMVNECSCVISKPRRFSSDRQDVIGIKHIEELRLQNSPYFCVFKYARAVKQKVWNEAENRERDWGETLKIPY